MAGIDNAQPQLSRREPPPTPRRSGPDRPGNAACGNGPSWHSRQGPLAGSRTIVRPRSASPLSSAERLRNLIANNRVGHERIRARDASRRIEARRGGEHVKPTKARRIIAEGIFGALPEPCFGCSRVTALRGATSVPAGFALRARSGISMKIAVLEAIGRRHRDRGVGREQAVA